MRLFAARGILGRLWSFNRSLKRGELSLIWDFLVLSATAAGADHDGPNLVALRVVRLFDYTSRGIEEKKEKSERFIDDERRRSQDYINKINKSEKKWQ